MAGAAKAPTRRQEIKIPQSTWRAPLGNEERGRTLRKSKSLLAIGSESKHNAVFISRVASVYISSFVCIIDMRYGSDLRDFS